MRTRTMQRLRQLAPAIAPFFAFIVVVIDGHRW